MHRRSFVTGALLAGLTTFAAAQTTPPGPGGARQAQALVNPIVPQTELERTFLAAFSDESMRAAFRRQLLDSTVALVLASNANDSPPRAERMRGDAMVSFIFTTAARVDSVFGPAAPRAMIAGRAALERLRGKYVVVNYGLEPMLTLEPDDIERFLATPQTPAPSAGPSQ
ncbi:MAG: hypothetical protein ACT4OF_00445 [Caulobacteraceae bacterium]